MSDTRVLLNRISAFRQRLENQSHLADSQADAVTARAHALAANGEFLSLALRQLAGTDANSGPEPVPLTSRARRLLEDARELVADQRKLTDDPLLVALGREPNTDPIVAYHQQTVALTEGALRLVQAFPASADIQLRMCEGVEAMLLAVRDRLRIGEQTLAARRAEFARIDKLARLLTGLSEGIAVPLASFAEIAESVLEDARRAMPIRFRYCDPYATGGPEERLSAPPPARYIAACSLTVASVVARVAPQDFEWASRPLLPVVAALLADVGMLRVPAGLLAKPTALTADERRIVERHPAVGAEIVRKLMPEARPIADAIAAHHEALDGTGYPNATAGAEIPALSRLLAVCSTYAGMASDRPHRPAHDPRSALMDLLVAAENGRLDRDFCEYVLQLSFHPVGTVVELTDGRVGVVVASHTSRVNLRATARPVVGVLTDSAGKLLPRPDFVDLAAAEQGAVVRTLSTEERRKLLATHYPDLCG